MQTRISIAVVVLALFAVPADAQKIRACKTFTCEPPPPVVCSPQALTLAVYALVDSPGPAPVVLPPCEHPTLVCASTAREAELIAALEAEHEWQRRLTELRIQAARCRG